MPTKPTGKSSRSRQAATPPAAAPPPPAPPPATVTAEQRAGAPAAAPPPVPAQPEPQQDATAAQPSAAATPQAPAAQAASAPPPEPQEDPAPATDAPQAMPVVSNALATTPPLASEEPRNLARNLGAPVQYVNTTFEMPQPQVPPHLPPLVPGKFDPDAQREKVRGNNKKHPRDEKAQFNPGMTTFVANTVKVYAHRTVETRGAVLDAMAETGFRVLAPDVIAEEYAARCQALGVPNDWADTRRELLKALLRQVDPQTVAEVYAEVYTELAHHADAQQ